MRSTGATLPTAPAPFTRAATEAFAEALEADLG